MSFNSLQFIVFFPIVAILYFLLPHRFRWVLLLIASYYFYACWKPEYLVLLAGATLLNYLIGLALGKAESLSRRKFLLSLSLVGSLGLLFGFKYLGFLGESVNLLFGKLGMSATLPIPHILLPIGISFYTFQALSYTIDVYRRARLPERHLGIFALYVSFFPQLVAGPIERSTHLLPQFFERHSFDYIRVTNGLKLMVWGFFKKLVIADRVAAAVNPVYGDPTSYTGVPLILATYLFAFQILCDFSAYTDIARGAAKILGFDLMENFRRPYLATSIRDFWRRWHISLTSWFRDYLYIPLGGNRVGKWRWYYNIAVIFVVSGLWHGAAWTFVIWGALHASYMLISIWTKTLRARALGWLKIDEQSAWWKWVRRGITFNLVTFGWIFFRANGLSDAWYIVTHLFRGISLRLHFGIGIGLYEFGIAVMAILFLELVHLYQESEHSVLNTISRWALPVRWAAYYAIVFVILCLGEFGFEEFIYFQF